ncbi:MAG: universal stress protein [Pirellulales bacterium]
MEDCEEACAMNGDYDLKILFATQYSDSCYRAIRGVAQMADGFRAHVTIVHVGPASLAADRELRSFFAEADHYGACERVRLEGRPAEALAEFARDGGYDLVIAPRSYRLGLPRPLHRSTRAELLSRAPFPMWTAGRALETADFRRAYRTVAVFLGGRERNLSHVRLAATFAARAGAQLRLLTVTPQVDESALVAHAGLREPLAADVAVERIERLLGDWSRRPTVDVTAGSPDRELPQMLGRCDADVLFMSEEQSCGRVLFRQLRGVVDEAPCPVVVVPTGLESGFQWSFLNSARRENDVRLLETAI